MVSLALRRRLCGLCARAGGLTNSSLAPGPRGGLQAGAGSARGVAGGLGQKAGEGRTPSPLARQDWRAYAWGCHTATSDGALPRPPPYSADPGIRQLPAPLEALRGGMLLALSLGVSHCSWWLWLFSPSTPGRGAPPALPATEWMNTLEFWLAGCSRQGDSWR